MKILITVIVSLLVSTFAQAEKREHRAHAHGAGLLNIVSDGNELLIELESPADDIVGFEHVPKSEKQKSISKDALQKLKLAENILSLPVAAGCTLKNVEVYSEVFSLPETVKQSHQVEHSEVHAEWKFLCEKPAALKNITVKLFDTFPKIHKLNLTSVGGSNQNSLVLTNKSKVIPTL